MPAVSLFDYARLMLGPGGTARQIAARMEWTEQSTRQVLRSFFALRLVHPAEVLRPTPRTLEVVWAIGEGVAPAGYSRATPIRPKPGHILFASLWAEMQDGATVLDAAEASGAPRLGVLKFVQQLRAAGLVHICAWEWRGATAMRPVAVWRAGPGHNARKPVISGPKRQRDMRARRSERAAFEAVVTVQERRAA